MTPNTRLVLQRGQDRRVRGGHPWIFSNEVAEWQGPSEDGALADVLDARGAFLGRAYVNRRSLICARMLTRGRDDVDVAFFVKRLERAKRFRQSVVPGEEALRLVYGESDQLPGLVVDRYAGILAVQVLTLGMERRLDLLREALEQVFAPTAAVLVADSPLRTLEGLALERRVWWGAVPERVEVNVGGFVLEADLLAGQKTGLFLDQRENRRRAEVRASGRRVLDLFCYQGAFALHALAGGARSALAVDQSVDALQLAERDAAANGLAGLTPQSGNVFDVVRELRERGDSFDLIVLDPPAFAKSRRELDGAERGYRDLNRLALRLLAPNGFLVTCSCSHHVTLPRLEEIVRQAAAGLPFRVALRQRLGAGPDHPALVTHPESEYLKVLCLQRMEGA